MLELLLVAFIQLNSVFGEAKTTSSLDAGVTPWGDVQLQTSVGDTTSYSGGNGWGDTHR